MKNSKLFLLIGGGVFALCICVTILVVGALFLRPKPMGTLTIYSYSETISDPDLLNENVYINSILEISPAIDGETIFVTDSNGTLELEVTPDTYTIRPVYTDSSYAETIDVVEDKNTEVTVYTENVSLNYISFNCSSDGLDSKEVRQALALSLDTNDFTSKLYSESKYDARPAEILIPDVFNTTGWADDAVMLDFSTSSASSLLEAYGSAVSFTVMQTESSLYEDDPDRTYSQALILEYWQDLPNVGEIGFEYPPFSEVLARRADSDFDAIRLNWIFDSNNVLDFYKYFFDAGNPSYCEDSQITKLIAEGEDALDDGDLTGYEEAVVEINNILMEEMYMIPITYQLDTY